MQPLLTQLLGLPDIEVEDYHDFGHKIILEVEARTERATCPRCRKESSYLHQNHWYFARDLDISQRQVLLKVNRRQFKCHTCGKPFSEELDFIGRRRKHTDRYAQAIVQQVLHSDTHNVALNNDLTDEEVWSMVKYMSKKKVKIDLSNLRQLGIDEIALRKGQKDFVVVLVDLDRHQLIGMAESRKQEDVKQVLLAWGTEVLEQILEVSIDLSGNYKGLVQKLLPNADIVADRFHVMKLVNQELNVVRNSVIKANEENQDKAEKVKVIATLKQSKYALLKPEKQLTEKQQIKLEEVKALSPLLATMHQQKENFREIFETAPDWTNGTFRLLDWLAESQENFSKSVGTICRWFGEVTGYFEHRTTSGVVEGINNKLKLIKRSGYGFRNFDNFQLRCLICWHFDTSLA